MFDYYFLKSVYVSELCQLSVYLYLFLFILNIHILNIVALSVSIFSLYNIKTQQKVCWISFLSISKVLAFLYYIKN